MYKDEQGRAIFHYAKPYSRLQTSTLIHFTCLCFFLSWIQEMAEGVLFNIAEGIIGRLGSLAFQEIGLIWGVQDEFNKLQQTVARFQAVLLDAEQKQANNEVKLWLQSIEDAVYEADDVVGEFYAEAQRRQMVPGNTKLSKKVRLFFSSSNQLAFGRTMGYKIKDIY